jgi:predicted helicase
MMTTSAVRLADHARRLRQALASTTDDESADTLAQTVACVAAATRLTSDASHRPLAFPPPLDSLFPSLPETAGPWRDLPEWKALLAAADELPTRSDRDTATAFYETFLAEYDGRNRRHRGAFYTPQPVVSFIVRSIDAILRTEFGLEDGLADTATWCQVLARQPGLALPDGMGLQEPFLKILDPATGTGTFLVEVVEVVHRTMTARWQAQRRRPATIARLWNAYVSRHLLPRLYGFELMPGPYAIAHIELRAKLEATGYRWSADDRVHVHLANALEEPRAVDDVRSRPGITVVLGNPPYAGTSRNTGPWISRLVDDYRVVGGRKLGERNPSWLLDDYVKFFRLGQHLLDRSGGGVLGMVTNHGFIANPTFRGMRESLTTSFQRIAILDLHGGVKKRAVSPTGKRDQNVFDISQGVCISLMRKLPGDRHIAHAEFWGPRDEKFAFLAANNSSTCTWQTVSCSPPHRLFQPVDTSRQAEFARFRSVHDLFKTKGWGLKTRKDYLLVDFDRQTLVERFNVLAALPPDEAVLRFGIRQSPYWDFAAAQRQMPSDSSASVRPVLFRPFDVRHVYYEKCMIERGDHKLELMRHMRPGNIALITVRRNESRRTFDHVFCTRHIAVLHSVSAKEANFFYPAFTWDDGGECPQANLLSPMFKTEPWGATGGLAPCASPTLAGKQPEAPVAVAPAEFHCLYAILHSPTYRERYGELLRVDFPRVPWGFRTGLFDELAIWGADLVALHLLEPDYRAASWNRPENPSENPFVASAPRFIGSSAPSVARGFPKYDPAGRVLMNPSCWFEKVSTEAWDFRVGGYRVLYNWLKDRRGRQLSDEDIAHYRAIVVAVEQTPRVAARIDEAIACHGGWPTAFERLQ